MWCYLPCIRVIFIENKQDYENPSQRSYEFVVGIEDDVTAPPNIRIALRVINIFDNDPIILYDGPCQAKVRMPWGRLWTINEQWPMISFLKKIKIKELHANYDTECKFQVYDADGLDNNTLRMEIEGSYNESEKFEFRNAVDLDSYTRQYTLL